MVASGGRRGEAEADGGGRIHGGDFSAGGGSGRHCVRAEPADCGGAIFVQGAKTRFSDCRCRLSRRRKWRDGRACATSKPLADDLEGEVCRDPCQAPRQGVAMSVNIEPLAEWARQVSRRWRPMHPPVFPDGPPTRADVELALELIGELDGEPRVVLVDGQAVARVDWPVTDRAIAFLLELHKSSATPDHVGLIPVDVGIHFFDFFADPVDPGTISRTVSFTLEIAELPSPCQNCGDPQMCRNPSRHSMVASRQ